MTPAELLDLLAAARAFEAMVRGPHVMWDGLCGHTKRMHLPKGFYDEVAEPVSRPTPAECEMCYVGRTRADEGYHVHEFQLRAEEPAR